MNGTWYSSARSGRGLTRAVQRRLFPDPARVDFASMNRRDFLEAMGASAAILALPKRAQSQSSRLGPVFAQIEKRHDEAVRCLQE
jgi:hypothetical protein